MSIPALRQLLATGTACLLLSACSEASDQAGCPRFKTGHFRSRHHAPGFHDAAFLDRTDSVQTETDQLTGDASRLAVKWVDDCHYELRLISSTKPYADSIQRMRKAVPLRTEIMGGTDRYYVFQCQRRDTDPVMQGYHVGAAVVPALAAAHVAGLSHFPEKQAGLAGQQLREVLAATA